MDRTRLPLCSSCLLVILWSFCPCLLYWTLYSLCTGLYSLCTLCTLCTLSAGAAPLSGRRNHRLEIASRASLIVYSSSLIHQNRLSFNLQAGHVGSPSSFRGPTETTTATSSLHLVRTSLASYVSPSCCLVSANPAHLVIPIPDKFPGPNNDPRCLSCPPFPNRLESLIHYYVFLYACLLTPFALLLLSPYTTPPGS